MSGPEDFNSDRTGKQVETMKGMAQIARQVAAISSRLLREWGATHSVTPEQQQELEQRFNETVAATDPIRYLMILPTHLRSNYVLLERENFSRRETTEGRSMNLGKSSKSD